MTFSKKSKIACVGSGAVGKTIAVALSRQGYPVVASASRTFASAQDLAGRIDGCEAYESIQEAADRADFVFITTFDGVIIHTEAAELGPKGKKEHWVRFRAEVAPDAGKFGESARKQVTDINSRLKGYVYKVPEAVGKRLACELKNILEGAGINACA